ncbi:hypothetical protein C8J57DRAFT_1269956 [Mycena rebaudengoi]|nr:hypothetical protein C8J57DRAFT_1269956 [Mycena rebaudengoi]
MQLAFEFFVYLGLATFSTAYPLILQTEPQTRKELGSKSVDVSMRGNKAYEPLFAAEQWKRNESDMRASVQESRSPPFNLIQWDDTKLHNTPHSGPQSTFEGKEGEGEQYINSEDQTLKDGIVKMNPEDRVNSRDEIKSGNAKFDFGVFRRKDISTGPVFFAKHQWEERAAY